VPGKAGFQPELDMGAIGEGGVRVIDRDLIRWLALLIVGSSAALTPARPAHAPDTGSSGKPLPGLPPTLRSPLLPLPLRCHPRRVGDRVKDRAQPGRGSGASRASLTRLPTSRKCPRREGRPPAQLAIAERRPAQASHPAIPA